MAPVRLLLLTIMLLTSTALAAATRFVAVGGVDSGNCTVSACETVTYAIGQAVAGDTIDVGPGTFNNGGNPVTVDKTLTLRGAQFGVDARNRAATETVLTVTVVLQANNVVFDGFTVTTGGTAFDAVQTSSSFSGYRVRNNILTNSRYGLNFLAAGATQSIAQFNWVYSNVAGIEGFTHNVLVDQNLLADHFFTHIFIQGSDAIISNNRTSGASASWGSVAFSAINNVQVIGNVIGGGYNGIGGGGDVINATVSGNVVDGVAGCALNFSQTPTGGFSNTGITITGNQFLNSARGVCFSDEVHVGGWQIHFNRIVGNAIDVEARITPAIVANLENNWWGCNEGPATCATVSNTSGASLDLDPWLVMDIAANPATIGLAGTSAVTSDFNQNSNGAAVAGFPNGVSVAFSATSGTMTPPAAPTSGGAAASTFHPAAVGTATVSATLDEETVSTNVAVLATTTVGLTSDQNPSALGLPVTFTATVDPTATGTITFFDGAVALGTVPIVGGSAQFTITLTAGSHTITARYSGDANFVPSVSPALIQVVNAVPIPTLSGTMLMLLAIGVAMAAWMALRSRS